MLSIKKYLLCVLILNSCSLLAMDGEAIDMYVEKIRNIIDQNHLGISKNICFRPLIGSYLSFRKSTNLPREKVADEMKRIESYITDNTEYKKEVFKKLAAKHWYVYYLMNYLIVEKLDEFSDTNGSTIDTLYEPDFTNDTNGIQKIIYETAYAIQKSDTITAINKPLPRLEHFLSTPYNDDIHFTILYGHAEPIDKSCLRMSTNGQHLELNDKKNNIIVWNMKMGNREQLSQPEYNAIQWSQSRADQTSDYTLADQTNTYSATTNAIFNKKSHYYFDQNGALVKLDTTTTPAVILYKQPTEMSHICQQVFHRNKYNVQELIALKNSARLKAIQGFPRTNLTLRIEKQIAWLSPNPKTNTIQKT